MIYKRLRVSILYSGVLLLILFGCSYFSADKLQAQTCPINVQAFSLEDVPGFPQTDSLVVCGALDTIAILIFPDPSATYPSGFNVTFELPAGMQYAGYVDGGFPGNVVNEFDVSDVSQPVFLLPNVTPGGITVIYLGVQSNCELIPPESAPVNVVIDYVADQFGTIFGCTEEFRPIGEYNGAFRIPVINLISAVPSDLTFTDFTTPQCDTIVVSQDGIDAYVDSFRLFISNIDLVNEFTIQSINVNGMPFTTAAPNYTYDPFAMQASLVVDGPFFPPNVGVTANGDEIFDEGERLVFEICLTTNDCASAQNTVLDFGATYGCYDRFCFLPSEIEVGVNFDVDFIPVPVATAAVVQQGDICGAMPILIDFTLESDLMDAAEGLYQDLRFGLQLCNSENLDFESITIGAAIIPAAAVVINPQPDGTKIINVDLDSLLNMDPDLNGLEDVDGDGFFDDLPGDQTLNFQLSLNVVCSDVASREAEASCAGLACDVSTIIVGGLRSCGTAFQVTAAIDPSANFSYGAVAVATNEVMLASGGIAIFVDDVGVGGTNTPQQITFEHGYQFGNENIMGCTGTASTLAEIIVEGNEPTITDLEYIVGSAMYIDEFGATTAIPLGNVTYEPLFDGARHRLIIDLVGLGISDPTTGLGTFQWQFEMDECQCFQRAATFTSRIIETCDACPSDCGIVKSCENLVINVQREACPDCDCFSVYVTDAHRVTAGYTDKAQTMQVDTASIPQEDKLRFLPGDTLFAQIAWIYPEENNVNAAGFDGTWIFYGGTQPVSTIGENLYNSSAVGPRIVGDFHRMPTVIDPDRSKLINAFVGRTDGTRDPLFIPDLPCIRFTSMMPDQSLGLNNVDLQDNYIDHAEGFVPGLWIRDNADGDCLTQFLAANSFNPLDTIYLEYNWKLLKNPGLDKTLTPLSPIVNGIWYGQTAATPATFRVDDCEVGPSFDFYCPEIDCSTDVTVNACDVVVEHTFNIDPNDVPPGAFSSEFRPINGLSFADFSIPPDLIYSGDIEIIDYTGAVIGTVPPSSLSLDNYNLVNFMGTDYYVLNPDSTATIGVEDSEYQDGGDDRGGLESDRYPSEMDVDHTIVGGTFPLLGVGVDQDVCEFKLRYTLDRVCPEDIDPAEFAINKGFSYVNTARSFATSNFGTSAFADGAAQYDTWLGVGTAGPMPPNFTEGETLYWPYSSTNFDIVMDLTQPSGVTLPNLYGQMQNPHNIRDLSSGANISITSATLPSITASLSKVLIADEAGVSEYNAIDICAENDGITTLTNVSVSVLVPASVGLIMVYEFDAVAPNNAGIALTATPVSTTVMGTTYQLDIPDLDPMECYQIVVETELLFCPINIDVSTTICVGVTSSCLPTSLAAQLTAVAEGVCRMASECYEYISEEAGIQVEWFIEPQGEVGLCEEVCFAARIKNVKTAPVVGLEALFFLPTGLDYIPGSWEVAYPGGDINYDADIDPDMVDPLCANGDDGGIWTSIDDPTEIVSGIPRGTTYQLEVDNSVQSYVAANGLPGILSETLNDDLSVRVDSNRIAFRFRAITICDEFTSGTSLRFISNAQNPCEDFISSNLTLTDPLIIEDADPVDFAQIVTFADPTTANCGEMGTINFTVANTSATENTTLNSQLCLNIPTDGITYQSGSIRFVSPAGFDPMAQETNIIGPDGMTVIEVEICITVPDNLGPGDFFQIAFDYGLSDQVSCDTGELGVEIASNLGGVPCAGTGQTCTVAVLNSVNPTIPLDFLPPLNLSNLEIESRCDDDPATLVYGYTFDLMNPGPDFMNAVEIEVVRDLDQDGMLDSFEETLIIAGPFLENVNLPMGASTTLTGELSVPTDIGCPVFIRIRQNSPCACDESAIYIDGAIPEFFNDLGTDQVLCPNSPLDLNICGDYAPSAGTMIVFEEGDGRVLITYNDGNGLDTLLTFEASPIDGADFSIMGDQLMVALNDGFGEDLPVDLNLTVNQGFCTEEFSINLRAAPNLDLADFNSTVCSDRKTTLDLMLDVVLEQNAAILWTPSTFLDDPTSPRPQICEPTMDISYTVEILLNDSSMSCGDTIMANITVADPGVLDLMYSGEVGCYDPMNPPVLTATSGFTNYTFYVMVGGVEVVVQDGANNVYMPSSPGGTYFVRADDGSFCGLTSNSIMVPSVPCGECPDVTNPVTPVSACSGEIVDSIKVSTSTTAIDGIIFVSFETQQTIANDIYDYASTGGTVLGSITPIIMPNPMTMMPDTMAIIYDVPFPENTTGSPATYYIYALLNPAPIDVMCRSFVEVEVIINPAVSAGMAMDMACEDENGEVSFTLSDYDTDLDMVGGNTVTYHLTMANAQDNVNAITANPYSTTSTVTLFVRVENQFGCFDIGTLDLTANQSPQIPISGGDQAFCEGEMVPALSVTDPGAGFTVEWYLNANSTTLVSGATLGGSNNEIITLTPTSIPSIPNTGASITLFAQIVDDATGCRSLTRTTVVLRAGVAPPVNPTMLTACESTDGTGIATFDLSLIIDDINATFIEGSAATAGVFSATNTMLQLMELSFHSSSADAMGDMNVLPTPEMFMNTTVGGEVIFVRVENTITGCFGTGAVTLNVSPTPAVAPASLTACEEVEGSMQATFDLTAMNSTVDVGGGNTITYHATITDAQTGMAAITPATAYMSINTLLFARVEDPTTGCFSVQMVSLNVNNNPGGNPSPMNGIYCWNEEIPDLYLIDLAANTSVEWYQDAAATIPVTGAMIGGASNEFILLNTVSMPSVPSPGMTVTVYAQLSNAMSSCVGDGTIAVTLTQNPIPTAANAEMIVCEDAFNSLAAEFDLSLLIDDINADFVESAASAGGVFTGASANLELSYHLSMSDAEDELNPITSPEAFTNTTLGSQTLFARVEDLTTGCYVVALVNLNVSSLPDADDLEQFVCEDPATAGSRSDVDLTALNMLVGGGNAAGTYAVEWYSDATLTMLVAPASVTVSDTDVFYARIIFNDAPMCENVATITYEVGAAPPQMNLTAEFCEDIAGAGDVTVDLSMYNLAIAGGAVATVDWFEDIALLTAVTDPTMATATVANNGQAANLFYARINDGVCNNIGSIDITVTAQPIVEAGDSYELCAGLGISLSNASLSGTATMGEWTVENAPTGGDGFVLPMGLTATPETALFTATVAGTYTLRLTTNNPDGPCDMNFDEVEVTVHPLPVLAPMPVEACGGSTISVDANVSSGTPTYMYAWVDLDTGTASAYSLNNTTNASLTIDVAGAMPGTIDLEVTVTDANGCTDTEVTMVTIYPGPTVMLRPTIMCINETVIVDANTTGGTPAYTHQWTDLGTGTASTYSLSNMMTQAIIVDATGATAGTINLEYSVMDANDCTITENVTVTINPVPVLAPMSAEVCINDVLMVDANTTGGTPFYIHEWMDLGTGTAAGYSLSNTFDQVISINTTGALAGTLDLEVTVIDDNGCTATGTVTITINPLPLAMPQPAEVCAGESVLLDGLPSGGTPTYMHQWTDLGTGTASGYSLSNMTMQVVTVDASSVTVNAGTGTVDLAYTVTDMNGCSNTAEVTVTINPLPIPNPQDAMVCVGESVTVDGSPTQGTQPYVMHTWVDLGTGTASNYLLMGANMQVVTIDASATTDAQAGTVNLEYTVTDVNACSNTVPVSVTINPLPAITPMGGNITCTAPQEVQIGVTTDAASPMYQWVGPGIVSGGTTASPIVNLPGVYTVTLIDGMTGCSNMDQVIVTQDPLSKCLPATFEIKVKGGE